MAEQAALIRSRLRPDDLSPADSTISWELELLQKVGPPAVDETIPPRDRSLPCPLSPNQQRVWFMEQLIDGEPVYNEAEAVRLRGELNVEVLENALNVIIARRENLRTSIRTIGGEPSAFIHDSWRLRLKQIDLSSLPAAQREAELERSLIDEPRLPYDLKTQPGIRATLLCVGPIDHVLILMMHHIVCDWASIGVFWRDLSALYRAGCGNQPLELPGLPIQHGDYAAWQQQLLTRGEFCPRLGILGGNPARGARAAGFADRSTPSANFFLSGRKATLSNLAGADTGFARLQPAREGQASLASLLPPRTPCSIATAAKRTSFWAFHWLIGTVRNCNRWSAFFCIPMCCERNFPET